MFLFRSLVIVAFVARLLTGCCAGGCPLAHTHALGADETHTCDCGHARCNCGDHCGHAVCCQPFGTVPAHSHEEPQPEPCGCPGHSHHLCVGTHLFATSVSRCELPAADVAIVLTTGNEIAQQCLSAAAVREVALSLTDGSPDARQLRAALQVYLL